MKLKRPYFFIACLFLFMLSPFAFAEDLVALPAEQYFAQVVALISAWGGYGWLGKVSGILLLLVASMQVSFIRPLWDKLGQAKAYVAPGLALIAAIVQMVANKNFSLPVLLAYLTAGAGAVFLRQILNVLKAIPGISKLWLTIFDTIASALGGKQTQELQMEKIEKVEAKMNAAQP